MIVAKNIFKSYGKLEVLRGINLEIKEAEIISIVGSSGAGKSTLLHILGTLDKQDRGDVFFDNVNITQMNEKQLSSFRNKNIGFIYQFHQLLPEFTALENICIPAYISGLKKKESEDKAMELLRILSF